MSTVVSPNTFAFHPLDSADRICRRTKKTAIRRRATPTPVQSPSSVAAIERQKALMLQDTEVMYTFGRNSLPVLMSTPLFRLGCQTSDRVCGKRSKDILRQTDAIFQQSLRDMNRRSQALTSLQEQLRVSLRDKRLETFRADFAAKNRFVLTDNLDAECSVCFDKKACYPITCCETEASKNYWCHDCFVEHAFESSEMGTKLVAACPLCREKFDVYRHLDRDGGAAVEQLNSAKRPKR